MANSKLRCRHCKDYFAREQIQEHPKGFCTFDHAVEYGLKKARDKREKQRKAAEKQDAARRREATKSLSKVCSEAQKHVNAMIMAADRAHGRLCIATGREVHHAGHYIHAGSQYRISWLRFFHGNIHAQNHESNTHKSGDTVNYRAGMVDRYGEEYVKDVENFKRLEDQSKIKPPTREEVAAMVKWCKAMTKLYKSSAYF